MLFLLSSSGHLSASPRLILLSSKKKINQGGEWHQKGFSSQQNMY
jgi:hypothetical protein